MEAKLLWRYLLSQILDGLIIFGLGGLILTGYLSSKSIQLSLNSKYLLGAFSAIFFIIIYTVYIPYTSNGRTPMRSLFKVGIEFPDKMTPGKLFMVSTVFLYCAPMITFGFSILANVFLVLFTQKATTIEQKMYSIKYYKIENNEVQNFRGTEEELEQRKIQKQKKLHPKKKKKRR